MAVLTLSAGSLLSAQGCKHTCAVVSGGAKSPGEGNVNGVLGDGSTSDHNEDSPQDVDDLGAGSEVTAVSAGDLHTCAVVSGGAKCWGFGSFGRLGDGNTGHHDSPNDVNDLGVAGSGVTAVSSGHQHTCAVVSGGAKCWGAGDNGQLGDGNTSERRSPVNVRGLGAGSGVTAISAGESHTCALLDSGGVKCWGFGGSGRLGNSDTDDIQSRPVDVKF